MTALGWRLLDLLSCALDVDERSVVLGDVAESGSGFSAGLRDLLGLVVRRQVGLWNSWQRWVALLGISVLAGVALGGIAFRFNIGVGQQLMAYRKYGVHFETGLTVREDVAFLIYCAGALIVWSWTCGFVLGSLSGRAAWLTWSVFYITVLNSAWIRFAFADNLALVHPRILPMLVSAALPLRPADIPFLVASAFGTWAGARRQFLSVRDAGVLNFVVIATTLSMTWMSGWYETAHEVWSKGVWHGASWTTRMLPFLLVSWPAVYLLARAYRQRLEKRNLHES